MTTTIISDSILNSLDILWGIFSPVFYLMIVGTLVAEIIKIIIYRVSFKIYSFSGECRRDARKKARRIASTFDFIMSWFDIKK